LAQSDDRASQTRAGATTATPSAAATRPSSLGGALSLFTGSVALIGAIVYAIMRYSYQEFYNVLGLTPDDVGPGSAAALTQSGVGVATFVALFAILPIAIALLASVAVDRALRCTAWRRLPAAIIFGSSLRPRPAEPGRVRLAGYLALPALAALGIYRAFTALSSGHWEAKQLIVLGIGTVLYTAKRYADDVPTAAPSQHETATGGVLRTARRLPSARWIAGTLMTVIGALVLGGSLPQDARATAHCAITRNEPVRFVHTHRTLPLLDHISVLRVRADPAVIRPLNPGSSVALPKARLVYLGDTGGRYFMFSPATGRALQIPDSSVVLTTIPSDRHCHYWQHVS
jgi:hypothetical protein